MLTCFTGRRSNAYTQRNKCLRIVFVFRSCLNNLDHQEEHEEPRS